MSASNKNSRKLSFIECIRFIKQLETLRSLIIHDARIVSLRELAIPINKLGIDENSKYKRDLLRQKLNGLIPIAKRAASKSQISTKINVREYDVDITNIMSPKKKTVEYDMFVHYEMLKSRDLIEKSCFLAILINTLDQMIGYFSEVKYKTLIQLLNPLRLIAAILSMPIRIIDYMGLSFNTNLSNTILSMIIRVIWIILLTTLSLRLGEKSKFFQELFQFLK